MRGQFPVRVVMDASGHAFRKMSILERTIFLRHAPGVSVVVACLKWSRA